MDSLEKKLGYKFNNRKLLEIALTHSSYASEHGKSYEFNNERLEFLGDAFLDAIVGKKSSLSCRRPMKAFCQRRGPM